MTLSPDNPLWRFSVAVYGKAGVARECLALQDSFDIDINMLLLAAWVGAEKQAVLSVEDFDRLDALSSRWQNEIIKPTRAARRHLEHSEPALYADLKQAELALEKMEQSALFEATCRLALSPSNPEVAIAENVGTLLRRHKADQPAKSLIAASLNYLPTLT